MPEGELKSIIAAEALEQFFRQRKAEIVSGRLKERHVPEMVLTPFSITRTNVASPKKVTGNLVGMILPYMVILMCMTGAIYPSIDLTAGEKSAARWKRCCAVRWRARIWCSGRVLVVLTASVVTMFLSISSNGLALLIVKGLAARASHAKTTPFALDPTALLGVAVMMIPMAVFTSALMVAAGLFARSSKKPILTCNLFSSWRFFPPRWAAFQASR